MNAYFLFLENEKRITFDHYTKTKIMSQIEQEEMLRKAMTHNPIFIDVHKPLITMMRLVIKGESEQIVRTIKKTLMKESMMKMSLDKDFKDLFGAYKKADN